MDFHLENSHEGRAAGNSRNGYGKKTLKSNPILISLCSGVSSEGLSSFESGGYICTIKESKNKRFDSTGFKKAHPDIAQEFTKESVSVSYDIEEV